MLNRSRIPDNNKLYREIHGPLDSHRIRLFGVDAPELGQQCFEGGKGVACGEMAIAKLASLIGDAELFRLRKSMDAFGRMVAVCRIGGIDIGRTMVEAGWATAFRKCSGDYVAAEHRARANKAGLWRWEFQVPEEYRAAQQSPEEPKQNTLTQPRASQAPRRWQQGGQCLIKGKREHPAVDAVTSQLLSEKMSAFRPNFRR